MANGMSEQEMRERAIKRVKEKRDFWGHAATYAAVNAFLVFIWWMSGARTSNMWFLWVMAGWGIGLVSHAVTVFAYPQTGARFEASVDAELEKMKRARNA